MKTYAIGIVIVLCCCASVGLSMKIISRRPSQTAKRGIAEAITDSVNFTCPQNKVNMKNVCTIANLHVDNIRRLRFPQTNNEMKISKIVFRNSSLGEIPAEIFSNYPNMHSLAMDGCRLGELRKNTFRAAKRLQHLYLPRNDVVKLSDLLFAQAYNLKVINLSFNRIADIDRHAFKNLTNLDKLFLSHNKIKRLDELLLHPLANLTVIHLDSNGIEILNKNLFQYSPKLRGIYLHDNRIMLIEAHTFQHLKMLKFLNLSNNQLREVRTEHMSVANFFVDNNQLRKLHLTKYFGKVSATNNSITTVTCASAAHELGRNYQLKELILERNAIQSIANECLPSVKELEVLNLAHNEFINFNVTRDFNGFAQLKIMYLDSDQLDYNDISNLRKTLPKLTVMYVSENRFNHTFWNRITRELMQTHVQLINFDDIHLFRDDLISANSIQLKTEAVAKLQMQPQQGLAKATSGMDKILEQHFVRIENKLDSSFAHVNDKLVLIEKRINKLFHALDYIEHHGEEHDGLPNFEIFP